MKSIEGPIIFVNANIVRMPTKKITPNDIISYKHVMMGYGIGKTEAYKKINVRRKELNLSAREQLTIKRFLIHRYRFQENTNATARKKKNRNHNHYIQEVLIKNSNFDPQYFCDCINAGKVAFPSKVYVSNLDLVYAYGSAEQINFLTKKHWFYCKPRHLPSIDEDIASGFDLVLEKSDAAKHKYLSEKMKVIYYALQVPPGSNVTIYQVLDYIYKGRKESKKKAALEAVIKDLHEKGSTSR
jgi:hypothetical protein